MIPLIDPAQNKRNPTLAGVSGGRNNWRVERGELRYVSDDKDGRLLLPLRHANMLGDWEVDFTRTTGLRNFTLDLPRLGGFVTMVIDTAGGNGGIWIAKYGDPATKLHNDFRFPTGRRTKLAFHVTRAGNEDRIALAIDGKPAGEWTGDLSKFERVSKTDEAQRAGLYITKNTDITFHAIRVRLLDGTAETIRPVLGHSPQDELCSAN